MSAQRDGSESLNGDPKLRAVVDTSTMSWAGSPSAGVQRKRVHRSGPQESGRVTSVVRYLPGARFPAHDHPEGEEILVLEGVFSDEHGDWPAGTYLLNPEGFHHAPFSTDGCLLFVKLRQAGESVRTHVALDTEKEVWLEESDHGFERMPLYVRDDLVEETYLERWNSKSELGERIYPQGAEYFVLEGGFEDESGNYRAGTWMRLPSGAKHRPSTASGCTLFVKYAGVASAAADLL